MSRSISPDNDFQSGHLSYSMHTSYARRIERRLVRAWKTMTHVTRKPQRASIMPPGFVLVNAKRRSIMFA